MKSIWSLVFVVGVLVKNFAVCTRIKSYAFEYAVFVDNVENHNATSYADVHICQLKNEEILDICREAITDSYLKTTKIDFVEGPLPGPEKVYGFTLCSWKHIGKPPVIVSACSCPTNPLLYLRNEVNGTTIEAYVSLREACSRPKN